MVTYAALSLNEFVDSMLVSNLLGSDAMAIVNLGMPLMLIISAVYFMIGNGGSTVYAIATGSRDHDKAGRSLTASIAVAFVAGLLILGLGLIFASPLASMLCRNQELLPSFRGYMKVLLLSAPFEIVILTFVSFLPSAGYPGFSTAVNVIANVINIIMDYVYIHFFHMGVNGAAWATLTGYLCATLVVAVAILSHRMRFYVCRSVKKSLDIVREIFDFGRPDAINQIGLSLQYAVCNGLVMTAAGTNGMVAFSLCQQSVSVMSVLIGAVIGSAIPLLSVLHGQRDFRGEAGVLKFAMLNQFAFTVVGLVLLEVFAPQAAALYNITEAAQFALSVTALRIFSLMFIPRNAVIVYYRYLKVIGLIRYSSLLSALDSFAAIIPIA